METTITANSTVANDNHLTDVYPLIYRSMEKINKIKESDTTGLQNATDEVTHLVFFGENIRRVIKTLFNK